MFIHSLSLKNFNNITDLDLRFNKINLINGNNGSGKSSILEAITFLLTNYLAFKLEDYIRWGKKEFELSSKIIDYNDNQLDYFISYSKTTNRKLIVNNECNDPYIGSDAIEYMNKLIDSNIALYSNISIQGESTKLISEKPTPRLEKLKILLGMKDVDNSVEKIKEDISEIKDSIKILESELVLLKDKAFNYLDEYELEDYSELKKEFELLEIKYEKFELENKLYEDYLSALNTYKKNINEKNILESKFEEYNDILGELNKTFFEVTIVDKKDLYNTLSCKKIELSELEQGLKEKDELEQGLKEYKKEIKNKEEEYNNIILYRIATPNISEEEYNELIKTKENSYFEFNKQVEKYKAVKNGECPTCGANYTSEDLQNIEKEINNCKLKYEELQNKINEYKSEFSDYNYKLQENKINSSKKENILSTINILKEEKQKIKTKIDSIGRISIFNLNSIKEDINNLNKLINKQNQYELKKNKIVDRLKEIKTKLNLYTDLKEPDKIIEPEKFNKKYFEEIKKDLYIYIEKEKNLNQIKETNKKIKKEEEDNIKLISEKENLLTDNRSKKSLLESTRKLLSKDFSSYLIDKGTEFIKNRMNEFFAKSYGKYNVTLQRDTKGADFYYYSEDQKQLAPIGKASGYEQQNLSIAFRMAIANLHKLGIYCFDEVDSDSSEENSIRLFKTILSQKFSQLFVITQKENTKEYLQSLRECSIFDF